MMMCLLVGHIKLEDTAVGKEKLQQEEALKRLELQKSKEIAGISLLEQVESTTYEGLYQSISADVRDLLVGILKHPHGKESTPFDIINPKNQYVIDIFGLKSLLSYPTADQLTILRRFSHQLGLNKNKNRSAALAAIMKEYTPVPADKPAEASVEETSVPEVEEQEGVADEEIVLEDGHDDNDEAQEDDLNQVSGAAGLGGNGLSRRQWKKQEQEEIAQILEEEGVFLEEEGKLVEDVEKLTGAPLPDDELLYAIPVCGPYVSLKEFKYRVKLTPGTLKKGKAVKQALELFQRNQADRIPLEKGLITNLNDIECVAIMIGDVKLSMPGLYAHKK